MAAATSGTVTVLFTDLVGSTEMMAALGEDTFDALRRDHFSRLRAVLTVHGGTEVKNTGDGLMATFASAVGAVRAAVAMHQSVVDGPANAPVAIRVGLALGEVTLEEGDVFGTAVVEAARLVGVTAPGQILATAVVRAVAAARAGAQATWVDSGEAGQRLGHAAVRDMWAEILAVFPDIHHEVERLRHGDDFVLVEYRVSGTQHGDWSGIPATGRSFSIRVTAVYEFERDELVCERAYTDLAGWLRQLGGGS